MNNLQQKDEISIIAAICHYALATFDIDVCLLNVYCSLLET